MKNQVYIFLFLVAPMLVLSCKKSTAVSGVLTPYDSRSLYVGSYTGSLYQISSVYNPNTQTTSTGTVAITNDVVYTFGSVGHVPSHFIIDNTNEMYELTAFVPNQKTEGKGSKLGSYISFENDSVYKSWRLNQSVLSNTYYVFTGRKQN